MSTVEFHHGTLCDSYEKQANSQGFTFGESAEWIEKIGYGLICAYMHGCITDGEFDKIIQRFQRKILLRRLKPLAESEVKPNDDNNTQS